MLELNYPLAFAAGLVSFFAPCVLPLLPAYISYVTGVSLDDLQKKGKSHYTKKVLLSSIFYILGFSLVFILLGVAVAAIGVNLRQYDLLVQRIGGFIILILGLEFAGVLRLSILSRQVGIKLPAWIEKIEYVRSFFVGIIFASAWTPCVGAILGSILALAAVTSTVFQGGVLLFVYSLGISLPFLIISLTLASAANYLNFLKKHAGTIAKVSGFVLAILGLLLLTDTYKFLNAWLFEVAFRLGYTIR